MAINNKLNAVKKIIPIQQILLNNLPNLCLVGTKLLLIVSIAIHAKIGAVKKLPVIAPKTKSLTPIQPDFAINNASNEANICIIIQLRKRVFSDDESIRPLSVPVNKPCIEEMLLG